VHVFLGITGAPGASYAARILEAPTEADRGVRVLDSEGAIDVSATELGLSAGRASAEAM